MKKILALCILATSISSLYPLYIYSNQEQEDSDDATRRICGGGVCCPVSQSCSGTLSVVSLAGSFMYTAVVNGGPAVVSVVPTQGACFTVMGLNDTITVFFLRPFSIAPVVLAQPLSGAAAIAISNVTNVGFTVTLAPGSPTSDTISFIAQQACI